MIERDETPNHAQNNLDTIVSSPTAPPNTAIKSNNPQLASSAVHTPTTAGRLYPGLEEMHPSKVHQSTTKQPESGLILGFGSPRELLQGGRSLAVAQGTPTKANQPMTGAPTSPGFEFKFTRPESELSSEAQKMMEGIREEAARIKAQLAAERNEEQTQNGEITEQLAGVGGRRIARPKGKAGRYSDLHMEEFKKMDSITGHASAFRAQPGRFQPVATSLKRSKSQAKLDDPETGLTRTKSTKALRSEREDDGANLVPAKRAKNHAQDDTTRLRPLSRDGESGAETNPSTPTIPRSKSGLPTTITTPTKASLARSASVKHIKTSMIPSLTRSPSVQSLASPSSKTENSNKYLSSISRLGSMKSILRRPQPLFSDDPIKQVAGTHIATPKGKSDLNKVLPSLPTTPTEGLQRTPTLKRVNFTPNTLAKCELAAASPSRSKIPALQAHQKMEPGTPNVTYPCLPKVVAPSPSPIKVHDSGPGDFTFRSDNTLNFGAGPTIRQVLPTDTVTFEASSKPLPAVPHGMPNKKRHRDDSDDEVALKPVNNNTLCSSIPSLASMPTVPHGMANKKRKHDDSDDEDVENREESTGPKAKKAKGGAQWEPSAQGVKNVETRKKAKTASRIPRAGGAKGKGRNILSMSRLNMLARPKERKGAE